MLGGGFLYFTGIIFSGLACVITLVFSIIQFAYAKPSRYYWLGGFMMSLAALVFFIFTVVTRVAQKASDFVHKMESSFSMMPDSSALSDYNMADSAYSVAVDALRKIEPEEFKGKVPEQFYRYLGFRDYYRLPLPYPYSIHCIETSGVGDLYDERKVERFDVNNNGEIDCGLKNICAISFSKELLLAKCVYNQGKQLQFRYAIFHFDSGDKEEFPDKEKMEARARELHFKGKMQLAKCDDYMETL